MWYTCPSPSASDNEYFASGSDNEYWFRIVSILLPVPLQCSYARARRQRWRSRTFKNSIKIFVFDILVISSQRMDFATHKLACACLVALFCEVCIGFDPPLLPICLQPNCVTLPTQQVNCKCDSECPLYGDCCLDYTPVNNSLPTNTSNSLQTLLDCWTVDFTGDVLMGEKSILMVSRCSQLSHPQNIECMNQSLFLPVTDSLSNYTFRNIYCALCNNISEDRLVPWQPRFHCDRNAAMQLSNVSTYEKINEVCYMYKLVSKSPSISMRSCVPHISTCPMATDASSQLIQNCTRGQYDLVAAPNDTRMLFRNRYCAQCNGYNDTQCLQYLNSLRLIGGMKFNLMM